MDEASELFQQRVQKLGSLKEGGIDPFPNNFRVAHASKDIHQRFDSQSDDEIKSVEETFSVAGRIMAIRDFGKASFIQIQDQTGRIQAYLRKDVVGDQAFHLFKTFDIGDFLGLEGKIFRTKTGELTLQIQKFQLLVKSLRPLPEKWHGLTDVEVRYRHRYLDLVANPRVKVLIRNRGTASGFK